MAHDRLVILPQFLDQFDGECGAALRDVEPDQMLEGVEASLGVFGAGCVDQQFGELLGFSDDSGASGECGLGEMVYVPTIARPRGRVWCAARRYRCAPPW
jgi:hypothetical protein